MTHQQLATLRAVATLTDGEPWADVQTVAILTEARDHTARRRLNELASRNLLTKRRAPRWSDRPHQWLYRLSRPGRLALLAASVGVTLDDRRTDR